ncbi:MAG: PilW family protein [Arenimonas sp.]
MRSFAPRFPRKQLGIGLVEMMVATACGLIVSSAAVRFLAASLKSNTDYVVAAAFTQDLRGTTDYVTRELRRAGYDENAMRYVALAEGSDVTSPFAPIQVVREDADNSCVVYAYDGRTARTAAGTGPGAIDRAAGEIRAMRRMTRTVGGKLVGVIEVAETSSAVSVLDCDAAGPDYSSYPAACNAATGWCALTDPRQLDVARFSILDNSAWTPPTASRNGSKLRELAVTLEAAPIGHSEYRREGSYTVRVRAECLRPIAPTDPPDTTGTLCNTAPGT